MNIIQLLILIWVTLGVVGGIIGIILDYNLRTAITVGYLLMAVLMSCIGGPTMLIFAIVYLFEHFPNIVFLNKVLFKKR